MTADFVLVADIGGTNARFALARRDGDAILMSDMQRFRAEEFKSLRDAAIAYLKTIAVKPNAACFAVAGPVTDAVIDFTNSPWALDVAEIKTALRLNTLRVVNDFEALAHGVRRLGKADFQSVRPGNGDPSAPVLVLGPGTGFGQAIIVPVVGGDKIIATEGGHVAFAPRTDDELEILRIIAREHPRVSLERVLSGPGLISI
ncbi:MAG: glucokinase, partial [Parvularculaceae bacterium]